MEWDMQKNINYVPFYLIIIGIVAFILIIWITPFGAGVNPDSIVYIDSVKSLLSGKGYSINGNPLSHFPPLFPLFLAAVGLVEINLVQAARFLNAILFGVNLGLFALATYLAAGKKFLTAICAVLFFLSSASLIELHSSAVSEPLFITFCLACIILLSKYLVKPSLPLLIASSLSMGLALLSRYTGLGFLPAALVMVYAGGNGRKIGLRIRDTVLWLIFACAPLGIFLIRNMILLGSATDRVFKIHPMPVSKLLTSIFNTTVGYIAPLAYPRMVATVIYGIIAVLFLFLLIIFIRKYRKRLIDIEWRSLDILIPVSCVLFSASYILFLYISISFMDASTPVDARLLSPILVLMTLGIISGIWSITQKLKMPVVWLIFIVFMALAIIIKSFQAIPAAADIQKNGLDYTSRQWQNSETLQFVKGHGGGIRIYSNGSDVYNFLTGDQAVFMPGKTDPLTRLPNPDYNKEIMAVCKDVTDNGALLVYFNQITWRWYLPVPKEIESTCQLPVSRSFADGTVYNEK